MPQHWMETAKSAVRGCRCMPHSGRSPSPVASPSRGCARYCGVARGLRSKCCFSISVRSPASGTSTPSRPSGVRGSTHFARPARCAPKRSRVSTRRSAGRFAKASVSAVRHRAITSTHAGTRDGCSGSSRSTRARASCVLVAVARSCAPSSAAVARSIARAASGRPADECSFGPGGREAFRRAPRVQRRLVPARSRGPRRSGRAERSGEDHAAARRCRVRLGRRWKCRARSRHAHWLYGAGDPLQDGRHRRRTRARRGGERTRLGLARLLLDDPDILLLDEPTNHLDVAALEWLERFLIEQEETILVSSHDRWFLDRVTSRTLSFEKGTIVEYRGGYSSYARQRAEREAATEKAAGRQAIEIERTEEFIRRYGAGQRSKEARGRGKKLARVVRIEAPERAHQHGWKLEAAHLAGDTVVQTTPLAVGYSQPLLRTGMLRVGRDARIAVVGPNGAGKTTLVRTLVGDLTALEGYVQSAPTARVAFLAQAQLELTGDDTVLDAMKLASGMADAEARDHLARFLFRGEDVFKSVGVLSGGERSRLALARLAARHANLLVLDEPTNHLDLLAREQLETVLQAFEGALLFVSHDRYFIDKLATEIWPIEAGVLKRFEGNWSGLQRLRTSGAELPMPEMQGAGGTAEGSSREPRVPRTR